MNYTPILAVLLLVSWFGCSVGQDETTALLQKFISYLNNMRKQLSFTGTRKLYWDDELAARAQVKAEACDKTRETVGNDGSFSISLDGATLPLKNANAITSTTVYKQLTRATFDRRTGGCKPGVEEEYCNSTLEIFNPQAWLVGCYANYECSPNGLIVCYTNRRMVKTKIEKRADSKVCPECSESFSCNDPKDLVCELKDAQMPRNLPEDADELLVQPVDNTKTVGVKSTSDGDETSAGNGGSKAVASFLLLGPFMLLNRWLLGVF